MAAAVVGGWLGVWGLVAGLQAGLMVRSSRIGKLRGRDRLLDDLPWRGDERVLDDGCGRGLTATRLQPPTDGKSPAVRPGSEARGVGQVMNSLSSVTMLRLGMAPMRRFFSTPPMKRARVGMLMTP